MLKLNSELRAASRTTLSGNWTIAALVTLLYLLIAGGVSSIPKVGTVVSLIITYPLVLWICHIVPRLVPRRKTA